MREIDVLHTGVPRAVCAFAGEDWVVDPGPEATVETLLEGLGEGFELRRIILTHIHFDHAGATGALVERFPQAEVWVHELGAKHLVDPTRLVASARQIYGDAFDTLWGRVVPVPSERLRVLQGGEEVDGWRVAYTPGHARHHVAYLHGEDGTAYCGDVAGVRILDGPVLPPTPPPDIDLEAWRDSIELVESWHPAALAVTHFGVFSDCADHLQMLRNNLDRFGELARRVGPEEYAAEIDRFVQEHTGGPIARGGYAGSNPSGTLHAGLARYWSKRDAG